MTVKVALITGAGAGIGRSTAHAFAKNGDAVAVTGRSEESIRALARELEDEGANVHPILLDVTDPSNCQRAIDQTLVKWGRLDVLINNAGMIEPIEPLGLVDSSAWRANFDTNLFGALEMSLAALPALQAIGGRIINLSSGAAHRAVEGWSAYCASKAALAMLTQSLHVEYGADGPIKAFGLIPGLVNTSMQAKIRSSGINEISKVTQNDLTAPETVAEAILWLASGAGDDLSGSEIDIRDAVFKCRAGIG